MKEMVLFVDDDKNLLDGLRRMLRPLRNNWEMTFCDSPTEALKGMQAGQCFDVVVVDMRMPELDGATLLKETKRICPNSTRLVLSGQAELESIFRSVGPAHQYLSKPCDADTLRQVVERACLLRECLKPNLLKELVSQVEGLLVQPESLNSLKHELAVDNPSQVQLVQIILRDVSLTTKLLQLTSSAFFGPATKTVGISEAVSSLGIEILRKLTEEQQLFPVSDQKDNNSYVARLNQHSRTVARAASLIAKNEGLTQKDIDRCYVAGLLHDVGRLAIFDRMPEDSYAVLAKIDNTVSDICQIEESILGATHADVGAYLLALWGLPDDLVSAVRYHHRPGDYKQSICWPLLVVAASELIVGEHGIQSVALEASLLEQLRQLGLESRLTQWQDVISEQLESED